MSEIGPDIPTELCVIPVTNGYVIHVGVRSMRDGFNVPTATYVATSHAQLHRILKLLAVKSRLAQPSPE